MKYQPTSEDQDFNEWYREFHLLFEDSHGNREDVMEIAQACYNRARESVKPLIVPCHASSHHADDIMGATAEALRAIHSGDASYAGLRFAEELSRRSNNRFDKEMQTIHPNQ